MPPSSSSPAFPEIDLLVQSLQSTGAPLRIFGYGSIIWQPSFCFSSRVVGCVAGYKRRFYQGSSGHRGTVELPGRVATLVPSEGATVWGVTFEIVGAEAIRAALAHLTEREVQLGGYGFHRVSFQPLQPSLLPQEAFAYIAGPENPLYLGKASLERQARQVALAVGPKGANVDYVRGVADFMRCEVPDGEAHDSHLFRLLRRVDDILAENAAAENQLQLTSSSSLKLQSLSKSGVLKEAVGFVAAF